MRALKKFQLPIVIFVSLIAGFTAGFLLEDRIEMNYLKMHGDKQIRLGQHKLINPLLACELGADQLKNKQLKPFRRKIEDLVAGEILDGKVSDISVYFRDLNDGMAFDINANDGFEPASLIKIPVMIDYLKHAENDPGILKKTLTFDGKHDWNDGQNYKPKVTLVPGKTYTVDELIRRMMEYSDNNAFRLLLADFDRKNMDKMLDELGIEVLRDISGSGLVTVKSYSIFLRVLYNASYLNREMSEKALEYLAEEDFPEGISSSAPSNIVVASKFGERSTGANEEIKQLHDFGIVYYPNRPYLLSIMTKGSEFGKLTASLQKISKAIYDEVDGHYKMH